MPEIQETKAWWKSKTIIFNVVSGLVGIATALQADKGLPPHTTEIFSTIVMVGNIILRLITDKPLGTSDK